MKSALTPSLPQARLPPWLCDSRDRLAEATFDVMHTMTDSALRQLDSRASRLC
jgi:hypothetical protein